ncbi:hypothetical protein [Methanococcus aeolicus]|uniref:hypothetical protein n=1 Tax=Methanococcus aeolicus TaxID=42879 RepID=UPI0021C7B386|nr:hypothetical protein [Methanococcus aeolicus]UXM85437.1 hypothetical protein N6C89_03960 [Methanococcus aeolicus]
MATSSFYRDIKLNKKETETFLTELNKHTETRKPKIDIKKELKKGEEVLTEILSHL